MRPSHSKITALENATRPEDVSVVRSFLGMCNYLKRFIPNYSTLTHLLRDLTKNSVKFEWTNDCERSFNALKRALSENAYSAYFDEQKEILVYCDASPVGVFSILLQSPTAEHNSTEVISYTSRSLSKTEQNYSQIERECLESVHACERNKLYLFVRHFTIYTDHKSLVNLLTNPNKTLPIRLERMLLRIQCYNFDIKHVKGELNISDYIQKLT